MLDNPTIKRIKDFVKAQPRTIQEISHHLDTSWLTADRYVQKICEVDSDLGIRTFRGGTRGALKIVFWRSTDAPSQSSAQERLWKMIMSGRKKTDFSPFDFYQFVDPKQRMAFSQVQSSEWAQASEHVDELFSQARKQILIFSGNLSWANLDIDGKPFIELVEELARKGIAFKIVSRVDIATRSNMEKVLSINKRIGKDLIDIRHTEQPLRGFVVDDVAMQFKEVKDPQDYRQGELSKKTFIFYQIKDPDWVHWMQGVFTGLFRDSISAKDRLDSLASIRMQ